MLNMKRNLYYGTGKTKLNCYMHIAIEFYLTRTIVYIYIYIYYIYQQEALASYKIIRLILQPFIFHYITLRLHVLSSLFSYIINVFFYE